MTSRLTRSMRAMPEHAAAESFISLALVMKLPFRSLVVTSAAAAVERERVRERERDRSASAGPGSASRATSARGMQMGGSGPGARRDGAIVEVEEMEEEKLEVVREIFVEGKGDAAAQALLSRGVKAMSEQLLRPGQPLGGAEGGVRGLATRAKPVGGAAGAGGSAPTTTAGGRGSVRFSRASIERDLVRRRSIGAGGAGERSPSTSSSAASAARSTAASVASAAGGPSRHRSSVKEAERRRQRREREREEVGFLSTTGSDGARLHVVLVRRKEVVLALGSRFPHYHDLCGIAKTFLSLAAGLGPGGEPPSPDELARRAHMSPAQLAANAAEVAGRFLLGVTICLPPPVPGMTASFDVLGIAQVHMPHRTFSDEVAAVILRLLTPEILIAVWCALINEFRVVVICDHPSILCMLCEFFLSLLAPFAWPHTVIPCCPPAMAEAMHSPLPYLIGCDADIAGAIIDEDLTSNAHACVVDCNTGRVIAHVTEELLSTHLVQRLSNSIRRVFFEPVGAALRLDIGLGAPTTATANSHSRSNSGQSQSQGRATTGKPHRAPDTSDNNDNGTINQDDNVEAEDDDGASSDSDTSSRSSFGGGAHPLMDTLPVSNEAERTAYDQLLDLLDIFADLNLSMIRPQLRRTRGRSSLDRREYLRFGVHAETGVLYSAMSMLEEVDERMDVSSVWVELDQMTFCVYEHEDDMPILWFPALDVSAVGPSAKGPADLTFEIKLSTTDHSFLFSVTDPKVLLFWTEALEKYVDGPQGKSGSSRSLLDGGGGNGSDGDGSGMGGGGGGDIGSGPSTPRLPGGGDGSRTNNVLFKRSSRNGAKFAPLDAPLDDQQMRAISTRLQQEAEDDTNHWRDARMRHAVLSSQAFDIFTTRIQNVECPAGDVPSKPAYDHSLFWDSKHLESIFHKGDNVSQQLDALFGRYRGENATTEQFGAAAAGAEAVAGGGNLDDETERQAQEVAGRLQPSIASAGKGGSISTRLRTGSGRSLSFLSPPSASPGNRAMRFSSLSVPDVEEGIAARCAAMDSASAGALSRKRAASPQSDSGTGDATASGSADVSSNGHAADDNSGHNRRPSMSAMLENLAGSEPAGAAARAEAIATAAAEATEALGGRRAHEQQAELVGQASTKPETTRPRDSSLFERLTESSPTFTRHHSMDEATTPGGTHSKRTHFRVQSHMMSTWVTQIRNAIERVRQWAKRMESDATDRRKEGTYAFCSCHSLLLNILHEMPTVKRGDVDAFDQALTAADHGTAFGYQLYHSALVQLHTQHGEQAKHCAESESPVDPSLVPPPPLGSSETPPPPSMSTGHRAADFARNESSSSSSSRSRSSTPPPPPLSPPPLGSPVRSSAKTALITAAAAAARGPRASSSSPRNARSLKSLSSLSMRLPPGSSGSGSAAEPNPSSVSSPSPSPPSSSPSPKSTSSAATWSTAQLQHADRQLLDAFDASLDHPLRDSLLKSVIAGLDQQVASISAELQHALQGASTRADCDNVFQYLYDAAVPLALSLSQVLLTRGLLRRRVGDAVGMLRDFEACGFFEQSLILHGLGSLLGRVDTFEGVVTFLDAVRQDLGPVILTEALRLIMSVVALWLRGEMAVRTELAKSTLTASENTGTDQRVRQAERSLAAVDRAFSWAPTRRPRVRPLPVHEQSKTQNLRCLNSKFAWRRSSTSRPLDVVVTLLTDMLTMLREARRARVKRSRATVTRLELTKQNLGAVKTTSLWHHFEQRTSELQNVDVSELRGTDRTMFLLNLHNLIMLHVRVERSSNAVGPMALSFLSRTARYQMANQEALGTSEIRQMLLPAQERAHSSLISSRIRGASTRTGGGGGSDREELSAAATTGMLLHLCLCVGYMDGPGLCIFSDAQPLAKQLRRVATEYISRMLTFNSESSTVHVPPELRALTGGKLSVLQSLIDEINDPDLSRWATDMDRVGVHKMKFRSHTNTCGLRLVTADETMADPI